MEYVYAALLLPGGKGSMNPLFRHFLPLVSLSTNHVSRHLSHPLMVSTLKMHPKAAAAPVALQLHLLQVGCPRSCRREAPAEDKKAEEEREWQALVPVR